MQRIVIIGGGFAGAKCAKTLRGLLPVGEWEIVVFSTENHMVFFPLLAEVASAAVSPTDMAAPLRQLLKGVHCRTEEVLDIDLANSVIKYEGSRSIHEQMKYDHIVIASGNTNNLDVIPGMANYAFTLKSVGDALKIQAHIIGQLERAELETNAEQKKKLLTFAVVGGGFSGVELAGELNDFLRTSSRFYASFNEKDIEVYLIHSHDHILPEVGPSLRKFALDKMTKRGVLFYLNSSAAQCSEDGIELKDGRWIKAGTVVCTIGTKALPFIERLKVPKNKNKIAVNADMSIDGLGNAWAIGDCAAVTNAVDGKLSPTTAQFAERQGVQAAKNIYRRFRGEKTLPFSHQSQGTLCSIGGKSAVADTFGIHISGFFAWVVWRGVYLIKLPSWWQRLKIAIAWAMELFITPSLTYVPQDTANAIAFTNVCAGEYIFQAGDRASEFYMIEVGEVEVLEPNDGGENVIRVLGPGEFFGESSLLERREHRHTCRARSDSKIIVMGKNIFGEMSERYKPFKESLARAISGRNS